MSKSPKRCRSCGVFNAVELGAIERLLAYGVEEPPKRATKDELESWVREHTALLNQLRIMLIKIYAAEIQVQVQSAADADARFPID
jgi:hypothetical protein